MAADPDRIDASIFRQSGLAQAGNENATPPSPTRTRANPSPNAFQPGGPAVHIAFEQGRTGGRLFATDNGASGGRILNIDPTTAKVVPLITGLPAGPTGQLAFQGGWIYWGAGSTTNSGVVSKADGGAFGQPDIPCQDITLSQNVFDSGGGTLTSGYSQFGHTNPGGTVAAFF